MESVGPSEGLKKQGYDNMTNRIFDWPKYLKFLCVFLFESNLHYCFEKKKTIIYPLFLV